MPFDPDGADSSVLDGMVGGAAAALTAVALVAGADARASGRAARAAVALARWWAPSRPVVLADLDLERPRLHELIGAANDEGVIDVIAYGLSPRRVARPAPDGTFEVLTAGEFVADAGAVLRSDLWTGMLLDIAARRATLLMLVPASADGLDAVIARAGAVLVLADGGEGRAIVERLPQPYAVIGVLELEPAPAPAGADVAEPAAAGPVSRAAAVEERAGEAAGLETGRLSDEAFERIRLPKDRTRRDALIADLRHRQRDARLASPPTAEVPPAAAAPFAMPAGTGDAAQGARVEGAADDVLSGDVVAAGSPAAPTYDVGLETLAPARRSAARPVRLGRPLVWTLGVVLMVSLLAGGWRYLATRLAPTQAADATPEAAPLPIEPEPQPPAGEQALPWVVVLEAHRELPTALERVDALAAAEPGTGFHVAPLEREGSLFYHVVAGPLPDSAAAVLLRDTLIARRHKTAATPTDVRAMPLAFHVGDFGTRENATQQLDELRRFDVPGYLVLADAADGEPLYRVYIGGFSTRAEADVVRQLMRAVGVRDSLVTRTGSIIP